MKARPPGERQAMWLIGGALLWFVVAPGTVAGLIPFWLTAWRVERPFLGVSAVRALGAAMVLAGIASLVESFVRFAVKGRGTPAPVAPPTRLVTDGQYRHVRNPMYVAILAIVLGQSLILGSVVLPVYAVALWLLFHAWVLLYEEPRLTSRFGPDYAEYGTNVRRWLPRIRPWNPSVEVPRSRP